MHTWLAGVTGLRVYVPAAASISSAVRRAADGAVPPVCASDRLVMPLGAVMRAVPLCAYAPTSLACGVVVVTDGLAPFVFLVNAPALESTGCPVSTPVNARIEPTPPVDAFVVNV